MQKKVYTIIKKIPGFIYPINTEFQILNDGVYVNTKEKIYSSLKRVEEFDGFDFDSFVTSGYMVKTITDIKNVYQEGELVVYNKFGNSKVDETFVVDNTKFKNCICQVISKPFLCNINCVGYKLRNVFTNEKYDHVYSEDIYGATSPYWFIDSHGHIQMTYFWLRPKEDKYRIAINNVFKSYQEAKFTRDKIKEFKSITIFKEYIDKWIG